MQLHFLLSPLYLVLNFRMNKSSLSFLTNGSRLWTFSKIVTFISLTLWPERLKWNPVAFPKCLLITYALCSLNRSCKDLSVSPMYCILQFWQDMQYTILVDLQVTAAFMSTIVLLDDAFTLLQICIKGQIGHLLHFFMPAIFLVGLLGPMGGTFVLTSLSLIFGGRLYAIKGGRGNTSFKWGSLLTMVLQCFLTIFVTEGNLGS